MKIISDYGTKFKNELFASIAEQLGVEHTVHALPYHPESNGKIEGFHAFLKTWISKHTSGS